jgi:uncharacterized protein (DUF1697 family)
MPRYAAFLRGINVSGHRVTGTALQACLTELGLEDAATFRASGNVIFSADGGEPLDALAGRIETALAASLGYAVPTYVRTSAQVRAMAAHEPFAAEHVAATAGRVQVLLLSGRPAARQRKQVLALASDSDRLAFHGNELYWLPNGGISDSVLDLDAIGAVLGAGTMRTKGTIDQIAARYFAP